MERIYILNYEIIFVRSKSVNITISDICGAPETFGNFEPAVEKRDSASYVLFRQPMPTLAFCWLFRVGY